MYFCMISITNKINRKHANKKDLYGYTSNVQTEEHRTSEENCILSLTTRDSSGKTEEAVTRGMSPAST